jgi:DNA helicase-4
VLSGSVLDLRELRIVPGAFWATLAIPASVGQLRLDGLPNADAKKLAAALESAVAAESKKRAAAAAAKLLSLVRESLTSWANSVEQAFQLERRARGWFSREFVAGLEATRPKQVATALAIPAVRERIDYEVEEVQNAVKGWDRDTTRFAAISNAKHLESERATSAEFFGKVEKTPLTREQIDAVVCFDSRVLLVASAGSGKTSTMIAKAAYALHKRYFAPESVLLLAFNNAAAAELRERLKARMEPLGLAPDRVTAKTFHAFGLDVIGQATGRRPSIAPWLESGRDLEALMRMVDELKDENAWFRTSWDMFRVVFGQDLPEFGKEEEGKDSWDRDTRKDGFWTLNGEVVKSRGELLIANWLFYNGVEYEYERPYEQSTADASHRQYNPDFYIPAAKAYLEHWALDEKGQPPPSFHGYLESMQWKRELHKQHGTILLETTMAQLWTGEAFRYLERELTTLGVQLDPNPDRPAEGRAPIETPRLARTFRTFMVHAKSNRISAEELRRRVKDRAPGPFVFRHTMFLDLYEQLAVRWASELTKGGYIDFEDMLGMAGDLIEQGRWKSSYELVMVDEFQDASQARARILQGLVRKPRTCLFAVGDDWQSINRFAGADLSVMTQFEKIFGSAVTLKLEQTFRCAPAICTISSGFVQRNPAQLRKNVRSSQSDAQTPVTVIQLRDLKTQGRSAIEKRIAQLQAAEPGTQPSVLILGRYNHDREHFPKATTDERVRFITVHGSKGLEADHVIVASMTSETLGFPSRIEDDLVLQLALPDPEPFLFAEERRLFYVALTRARKSVTLLTEIGRESTFITELVRDYKVPASNFQGEAANVEVCPNCGRGTLVQRKGPWGRFLGCSTFPACKFTRKTADTAGPRTYRRYRSR